MTMQSNKIMTAKSVLSTLGSVAAAAMVARSVVNDFLPYEIRDYLYSTLHSIFSRKLSSEITMIIEEFEGLESNDIFEAAELYIGSHTKTKSSSTTAATRLKVRKRETSKQIQVNVDRNEQVEDVFDGVKFKWVLNCHHVEKQNYYNPRDMNSTLRSEVRAFQLTFPKNCKDMVIQKYLPHILQQAEFLKQETKTVQLFTVEPYGGSRPSEMWTAITLNHPSTFETVAMDAELKEMIIEDLGRFVRRKDYYRRVGKAWKRGYLLYGPPGTGKSSLIAAMANFLNFDIYDLELSGLRDDSDLRRALLGTANKSIIVVEDIDCSIELDRNNNENGGGDMYNQQDKVTLSGLLNFIDGLWSTCGDERIIIFTTNQKDKLDPALLRPGRMDLHIHMSYCTPCAFNLLAHNYLGVEHHELFMIIEQLIDEVEVTPAEVAEQLMRHDDPDLALEGLIDFLELKKVLIAKTKLEGEESDESKEVKDEDDGKTIIKDDKIDTNRGSSWGLRGGRLHRARRTRGRHFFH